jgi:hypothetical protein
VLRGPEYVLLVPAGPDPAPIEALAASMPAAARRRLRLVAIGPGAEPVGVPRIDDPDRAFAATYGRAVHLIRPDKHVGWRGPDIGAPGLGEHLRRLLTDR